jgi:hypothetical protein
MREVALERVRRMRQEERQDMHDAIENIAETMKGSVEALTILNNTLRNVRDRSKRATTFLLQQSDHASHEFETITNMEKQLMSIQQILKQQRGEHLRQSLMINNPTPTSTSNSNNKSNHNLFQQFRHRSKRHSFDATATKSMLARIQPHKQI